MAASALFILDIKGRILITRDYRGDVPPVQAERFFSKILEKEILRRWAARQAQEMMTTIERRNRESELMALAGLHTVSMLDSSFLQESQSPTSRRQGNVAKFNLHALG